MTALTIRLPNEKHIRLKALAKSRGTPLNRLFDEMTTIMLAEFDAETLFQIRAQRGAGQEARGLELLRKAAKSDMNEITPTSDQAHPAAHRSAGQKR